MLRYGVGIIKSKMFKIMEKFHASKTLLRLAGGGMHPPHFSPPPESTPVADLVEMDSYQFCLAWCCAMGHDIKPFKLYLIFSLCP